MLIFFNIKRFFDKLFNIFPLKVIFLSLNQSHVDSCLGGSLLLVAIQEN